MLGTAAAFAVARYRFFGVNSVSFLVVIPIALPGVITGIALQSSFAVAGIPFSLWTIMIGHATFCIVIVFNNVIARLRRMQPSIEDASMDLGANGLQTFRYVLLPELRSALVAGALLAFALSWDEVIVTIFTAGGNTTIPIWIWTGLRTGGSGSEINVVAAVVVRAQHRARVLRPAADDRRRRAAPGRGAGHARGRGRLAVRPDGACARPAGRSPAVALACLATACGTSGSTADAPPAGPSAPATALPRAEGTLRLLARQGYAENGWVRPFERSTGCRVEVRYADSAEGLRRAADGYAFDVASIPGSLAYAVVQDGAARALNPALVPQRASFRAPFRDPAAGRAGARRYGVSFLWTPRLELWRKTHPQARARDLGAALVEHQGAARAASRSRTRRSRSAMPRSRCASSRPRSGSRDPYALNETQFAAAVALTKRRMHLAGALWQLPGDEIDAFAGGLVDVGAGDWYTARADPRPERRRRPHAARARARPARSTSGCSAPTRSTPAARIAGCATPRAPRVQAQVARYFGATPVNARRLRACSAGRPATRCTPTRAGPFLKRIAFRHTPVENCGGGRHLRAVRALGAGLARRCASS